MSRGVTLIELMVGLVTATIMAAVCAKVLQLGIMTYTYSVRQNSALTQTRKALAGDGARYGALAASRGAHSFSALGAASLAVKSSTDSVITNFFISGSNLYRTKSAETVLQADAVASIAVSYYNMDASGLIMTSTAAESSTMATTLVTVPGKTAKQKNYTLFSGAQLRNHP